MLTGYLAVIEQHLHHFREIVGGCGSIPLRSVKTVNYMLFDKDGEAARCGVDEVSSSLPGSLSHACLINIPDT
jgi:hypothetical protein